jgi:hypothetical protein
MTMAMHTGYQTEAAVAEKNYLSGGGVNPEYYRQSALGATAPTPAPVSAITDVHRTFEEARILASRVKDIVGRIVGYVPEDPNKCGGFSDAIFDYLKSDSVDTRQAINEAMDALMRLERQLP